MLLDLEEEEEEEEDAPIIRDTPPVCEDFKIYKA